MTDIFTKTNLQRLLRNRVVWFFGDSNVRALYKDLVWLWEEGSLIPQKWLRSKLENSFVGDRLTRGGSLTRGRDYREDRRYEEMRENGFVAEFSFLTKCWSQHLQAKFQAIQHENQSPDVIIINSLLWDICRWGPNGVTEYKANLFKLFLLMKEKLAKHTLVLWLTTSPVSSKIKGAFLIEQLQFMQNSCRFDIMEGNLFARDVAVSHGFDVIDVHFYLLHEIKRRCADGVHWNPNVVRFITNIILTHITLVWQQPLPGNFSGPVLDRMIANTVKPEINTAAMIDALDRSTKPSPNARRRNRNRNRNRENEQNEPRKRGYDRSKHYAPY